MVPPGWAAPGTFPRTATRCISISCNRRPLPTCTIRSPNPLHHRSGPLGPGTHRLSVQLDFRNGQQYVAAWVDDNQQTVNGSASYALPAGISFLPYNAGASTWAAPPFPAPTGFKTTGPSAACTCPPPTAMRWRPRSPLRSNGSAVVRCKAMTTPGSSSMTATPSPIFRWPMRRRRIPTIPIPPGVP